MVDEPRVRTLRIALIVIGLVFAIGTYPLIVLWPSGWSWGDSHYLPMIISIYVTLGVCLVLAARAPLENRGLIWFAVSSSAAHALVMAVQSFCDPAEHGGHLVGDVPGLLVVAVVLAVLTLRARAGTATSAVA